ncbi:hypothetical protein J6590_064333 [Homalodisca vitripennis]|nr:hypothetical protein J6590_064333 [Homalodisca vitripennis]
MRDQGDYSKSNPRLGTEKHILTETMKDCGTFILAERSRLEFLSLTDWNLERITNCAPDETMRILLYLDYASFIVKAQKNDKDWTVQKRLLSARRASQMGVFDNEIERWDEVDVPYLPSQLIGSSSNK